MELHAYTRTISDVFSQKRKYVVPRFQRPYSWEKEQIRELIEDIFSNIVFKNGEYSNLEYFIGSMVLIGDEKDLSMQIVDGQQRLTTLTIFLSALCQRFIEIDMRPLADSIYSNYISGIDDNAQKYFKLENENPKPFLQKSIQHIDKSNDEIPSTEEEKSLASSYTLCLQMLSEQSITKVFGIDKKDRESYKKALISIRDQIVNNLKVIYITVKEEDEAYTIFETLNARGMNLSFVDLIKNRLFKSLIENHPDDDAKTYWRRIRDELTKRDGANVDMEQFIRHWWISKYSYASKENIYPAFKKEFSKKEFSAIEFIKDLHSGAVSYMRYFSPVINDFPQQQDKKIYSSLLAIKNFNITQNRPIILSLFDAYINKNLTHANLIKMLGKIERFHFAFNTICSMRPSGIEGSYSKAARDLRNANDKPRVTKILTELDKNLQSWMPDKERFVEGLCKLTFSDEITKDKKAIQYLFLKIETLNNATTEFEPSSITIEHIAPQSDTTFNERFNIGNLIPLGEGLNVRVSNKKIAQKVIIYKESKFSMVKKFVEEYEADPMWDDERIKNRAKVIANEFYDKFLSW
ncbi:DUF262 domain-containing protein [Pectobacterium carotovorum]|uniref:DUF262 domain-containing protein n=1 Tax=Pectobacterium carotovorum TaxID=554 RepID=UPI0021161B0A|nr:DUF262 domain-containing protein [Pectobacterium carotovorum]MCQ8231095.1 DUF262 domain-containing HNH endonuclease family protein [Pectobacterium carotovorum]